MDYLFPPIEPYITHNVKVDDTHTVYVEECGNKQGIPVLFLHGGPGAGCSPLHRRFFDPDKYRIILFDQRGSGKSTPHASLENNTTQGLLADIETIRTMLGIDSWVLFGGSWGSTLALICAIQYKEFVRALVLRGIFLCRDEDIQWFYQHGASRLYPDYWLDFTSVLADKNDPNIVKSYYELLTHEDGKIRDNAAYHWSLWEARCATLLPDQAVEDMLSNSHTALSMARIECHYFINKIFLEEDYIMKNVDKVKGIPTHIVHGRYDTICPMDNAQALAKALPDAEFYIAPDAGHAVTEISITKKLVDIMNQLTM